MKLVSFLTLIVFSLTPLQADEDVNQMVDTLKPKKSGTRKFIPRGSKTTHTRSVRFNTRGIPKNIQVAEENGLVKINKEEKSQGAEEATLTYEVVPEAKVSKTNILFKLGSTEFLNPASYNEVAKLAAVFKHKDLDQSQFVIEGHASSDGQAGENLMLSQRRAEAILAILQGLQVDTKMLVAVGHGEAQAKHPETAPEHLLVQDRQVIIYRLGK